MKKIVVRQKSEAANLRTNEKKWSKPLMAAGWNVIPNIVIEKQEALGLDALDMNIILHLSHYWWQPDNVPHPSVATIARAIQVTPRTVQKRIAALEKLGFLRREERRFTQNGSVTNRYHFDGLIKAATPYAEEKVREIEAATAAKQNRLARKKPKLVVSND
ncbi:MAG: helix-turn-helix domain-containing protein [Novosphingobium sp.]